MRWNGEIGIAIVAVLAWIVACPASAGEQAVRPNDATSAPASLDRFIPNSTYAERKAADPRRRPVEVDSLVLPHGRGRCLPRVLAAGGRVGRSPGSCRFVWQIVPMNERYKQNAYPLDSERHHI